MNSSTLRVGKNISLSIIAQLFSLMVSFLLYLIVPKFIDEYQYSYWQRYVLYVGYVGIFHLGLLDGIVLRYSQYDYDNIDKKAMQSQFQTLFIMVSFFMLAGIIIALTVSTGIERLILILASVGIFTKNLFVYTQYTFQITNRIRKYTTLIIMRNCIYGVVITVLLFAGVKLFYWFSIADLICDVVANALVLPSNKGLYLGKPSPIKMVLREARMNITSGAKLLLANWSAILLVGEAKMMIQLKWGELVFGKASFAFSVTSVFLSFITAISIVLFPSLKRIEKDRLPHMYKTLRNIVSPILIIALLIYFPACFVLEKWLPKYAVSLNYLGILLPTIVYTSKVTLLTNNYLKAYRKESLMLYINIVSVALASALYYVCAFVFGELYYVLYTTVFVLVCRSIISEMAVMRIIRDRIIIDWFYEAIMTILFMICAMQPNKNTGFILYAVCLIVYVFLKRNLFIHYIKEIKWRLK